MARNGHLQLIRRGLCCRHNAVWVEVNRKKYGVNGMAPAVLSRWGYNVDDLDDIWRTDPESYGGRVSIGPLIDDGLSLGNDGVTLPALGRQARGLRSGASC